MMLANYIFRTFLAIAAALIVIGVPVVKPFVGLLRAFCFDSHLGIKDSDHSNGLSGRTYLFLHLAFPFLFFGTQDAFRHIIEMYQ